MKASLAFVLHAHLPFVRHPEHDPFLEEDWFFEAVTESYVPLIDLLERLRREEVPARLALSISPTLGAMLEDELLGRRLKRYIASRLELSEKEAARHTQPLLAATARMYRDRFKLAAEAVDRGLLKSLRSLEETGSLELLTATATHGFLPLLLKEESLRAQASVGYTEHARRFGRAPKGVWLGECAVDARVPAAVRAAGFGYFFVDRHGLLDGRPRPGKGPYRPARTPAGPLFFARDMDTAHQVWSASLGYPGDPAYREFYRDLGYDGDLALIGPYLHPDRIRRNLGLKYHRVTGKVELKDKELYDPAAARARAEAHAADFLRHRNAQAAHLFQTVGGPGEPPVIPALYDAELFGHWWFEGPLFLESFFRLVHTQKPDFALAAPSDVLETAGAAETVDPEPSSWGDKGYFEVWLNGANDWVYPHLHSMEARMVELANRFRGGSPSPLIERALSQCARETLLAQASDWPFLMTVGTHVDYAKSRVEGHVAAFQALADQAESGAVDEKALAELEGRNNLFPGLDFRVFATPS